MFNKILSWYFTGETLLGGRQLPANNEILEHNGPIVPFRSGLHACERIIDSLTRARYCDILCRVELWNVDGSDPVRPKRAPEILIGDRRSIKWRLHTENILGEFSRQCALGVIHLWDAPSIVCDYLNTGKKDIQHEAFIAASNSEIDNDARSSAIHALSDPSTINALPSSRFARSALGSIDNDIEHNKILTNLVNASEKLMEVNHNKLKYL